MFMILSLVIVFSVTAATAFSPMHTQRLTTCARQHNHLKVIKEDFSRDVSPVSMAEVGKSSLKNIVPFIGFISALYLSWQANSADAAGSQYLKDPTPDFKDEESRVAAFRDSQIQVRKSWDEIVARLEKSEVPEETEKILIELKSFLSKLADMPIGVKKRDFVKLCRAKKFNGKKIKPTWTTKVEIAYEALIQEINRQLNPVNVVSLLSLIYFPSILIFHCTPGQQVIKISKHQGE